MPSSLSAASDASLVIELDFLNAMASAASQCNVDMRDLITVARSHGDDTYATNIEQALQAKVALDNVISCGLMKLEEKYGTGSELQRSLLNSTAPPSQVDARHVNLSGSVFKTKNFKFLSSLWRLLNPSYHLQDTFFKALESADIDVSSCDDFMATASSVLTHSAVMHEAQLLSTVASVVESFRFQ